MGAPPRSSADKAAIPGSGTCLLRGSCADMLAHRTPMGILLMFSRIGVLIPLQPESEPVHIALVHGQLVLGLELDVWLVGENINVCSMIQHHWNSIAQREYVFLLRKLHQYRSMNLVQ